MKCAELQSSIPVYPDGLLSDSVRQEVGDHLEACVSCREMTDEITLLRSELAGLAAPLVPSGLAADIKRTVTDRSRSNSFFSPEIHELLKLHVMPYLAGVSVSVTVAFTFLTMMFSGILPGRQASDQSHASSVMIASAPYDAMSPEVSPIHFAQMRQGLGSESPSVNPQGALIALTRSLVRGEMRDDDVVVVADVFGNGLAKVAEVIESPRDEKVLREIRDALESDPEATPFVPVELENRPDSVRVVFGFYNVKVRTGSKVLPHTKGA